jgi:hypothetical protein
MQNENQFILQSFKNLFAYTIENKLEISFNF